jgi:ribonuclease D
MLSSPEVAVGASYECPPYTYITKLAALEKVLPDILAAECVGLDTETTGLSAQKDYVRLVQVSIPGHTWLIDLASVPAAALAPLMDGGRTLIAHNAKFDLKMLMDAGLPEPTKRLFDTMVAAQVLEASDVE